MSERLLLLNTLDGHIFYVATIPHTKPSKGVRLQLGTGRRFAELYTPEGRDEYYLSNMVLGVISATGVVTEESRKALIDVLTDHQ